MRSDRNVPFIRKVKKSILQLFIVLKENLESVKFVQTFSKTMGICSKIGDQYISSVNYYAI